MFCEKYLIIMRKKNCYFAKYHTSKMSHSYRSKINTVCHKSNITDYSFFFFFLQYSLVTNLQDVVNGADDRISKIWHHALMSCGLYQVVISVQTLERNTQFMTFIQTLNLLLEVALFLPDQFEWQGKHYGCKLQHIECLQAECAVTYYSALDPRGVELRCRDYLQHRLYRNPGPNFSPITRTYVLFPSSKCNNWQNTVSFFFLQPIFFSIIM